MNAIETSQLTRVFGSRWGRQTRAVDSVSMEVPQGTVFGLLGANGAGKSTLLKLLIGHLRVTSGSAALVGQTVVPGNPALWNKIGYVSQARYLPATMTASECLRFTRAFHPNWDDAKVRRLTSRLELPLDVKIRDLSRGHSVRLQIVLALAHNPEVILLDEPTSGLDPVGRRELLTQLIEELGSETGRTVIFSSHQVDDIERMADALAIMDAGRIVANGPIDTLKVSRSRVGFANPVSEADLKAVPGLVAVRREQGATVAVTTEPDNAVQYLRSRGAADAALVSVSLEQVFFDYVNRRQE
ncbi:MAG TPA: ABC transporter ATP-binding protein [Bryobacteraceae bacterium]|jgi:ABC-2 type transport system ATP-binding protein